MYDGDDDERGSTVAMNVEIVSVATIVVIILVIIITYLRNEIYTW